MVSCRELLFRSMVNSEGTIAQMVLSSRFDDALIKIKLNPSTSSEPINTINQKAFSNAQMMKSVESTRNTVYLLRFARSVL
jgi:hypothetical protein